MPRAASCTPSISRRSRRGTPAIGQLLRLVVETQRAVVRGILGPALAHLDVQEKVNRLAEEVTELMAGGGAPLRGGDAPPAPPHRGVAPGPGGGRRWRWTWMVGDRRTLPSFLSSHVSVSTAASYGNSW